MRNYQLMRSILCKIAHSESELDFGDFFGVCCGEEARDVQIELFRLKEEGLIKHNLVLIYGVANGKVQGLTKDGREFYRNIENERVWLLIKQTLEVAQLDLSYPLLKEVCDEIVRRYVMSKIPSKL